MEEVFAYKTVKINFKTVFPVINVLFSIIWSYNFGTKFLTNVNMNITGYNKNGNEIMEILCTYLTLRTSEKLLIAFETEIPSRYSRAHKYVVFDIDFIQLSEMRVFEKWGKI